MHDITEALGIPSAPANLECADPLPLEVPVRVRGLAGNGNLGADSAYEPFLEDTFTVLVSPHGAVLRLASYAAPGQMVTITSPRFGLDLPARVVRYRAHADVKGYAEIEFIEREVEPPRQEVHPDDATVDAASATVIGLPSPLSSATQLEPSAAQPGSAPACAPPLDTHSALAAAPPIVLAPLADLLAETPSVAGAHAQREEISPAKPKRRKARAKVSPATARKTAASTLRTSEATASLETLLATRKAAEEALPPAQELAQRLLEPGQLVAFAAPHRPRKRWLAAAAGLLLTLGAAGTWGVVTASVSAFGPLPEIAAFAAPEPPVIVPRRAEALTSHVQIETEPAQVPGHLVDPDFVRPLVAPSQGSVPQQRRAVVSELPEYELSSVNAALPAATQAGALEALAPRNLAPARAPQPVEPQPVVGGMVKPPQLIEQAPIVYPAIARAAHVEGVVVIDAQVDETGRVAGMRVISGHSLLHQAAKESLASWRYEPGSLNGQPTAMHVYVTIQFKR